MNKIRIYPFQLFVLTVSYTLGTAFFLRPGGWIRRAGPDAWMVPLAAGAVGVAMACLWLFVARRYPEQSLVGVCVRLAGPWAGGAVALLYVFYFLQVSAWVVRNLGDFMKLSLMPKTPLTVFHLGFLVIACYAVRNGAETVSRTTESLLSLILFTVFSIFVFMFGEWNWERLQPSFRIGFRRLAETAAPSVGFPFTETIAIWMFFPYIRKRREAAFLGGLAAATVLLAVATFFTVGILGVPRASRAIYPFFTIAQEMQIPPFFEHLEATVSIVLLVGIYLKLSIALFAAVEGVRQLFRLNGRTVAWPLGALVAGLALQHHNILENLEWDSRHTFAFMLPFGLIFPLALAMIAVFRVNPRADASSLEPADARPGRRDAIAVAVAGIFALAQWASIWAGAPFRPIVWIGDWMSRWGL